MGLGTAPVHQNWDIANRDKDKFLVVDDLGRVNTFDAKEDLGERHVDRLLETCRKQ